MTDNRHKDVEYPLADVSDYDLRRCQAHIEKCFERLETVEEVLGEEQWLLTGMARLGDVHKMITNERRRRGEKND